MSVETDQECIAMLSVQQTQVTAHRTILLTQEVIEATIRKVLQEAESAESLSDFMASLQRALEVSQREFFRP